MDMGSRTGGDLGLNDDCLLRGESEVVSAPSRLGPAKGTSGTRAGILGVGRFGQQSLWCTEADVPLQVWALGSTPAPPLSPWQEWAGF